jgi:hypothetical protein
MSSTTPNYHARLAEQQLPGLIEQYTDALESLINRIELLYPYAQPASESKADHEADVKRHQEALGMINTAIQSELGEK